MGFEKMPSPEEMAKIQKERALSDADLVKGGAEYVVNEDSTRLEVTEEQERAAEKEMILEKIGIETIRCPESIELIKKLRSKLLNYDERISRQNKDIIIKGFSGLSEREMRSVVETRHKRAILAEVLLYGEFDIYEFYNNLKNKNKKVGAKQGVGSDDLNILKNACGVINDYCENAGKNVSGGTGF